MCKVKIIFFLLLEFLDIILTSIYIRQKSRKNHLNKYNIGCFYFLILSIFGQFINKTVHLVWYFSSKILFSLFFFTTRSENLSVYHISRQFFFIASFKNNISLSFICLHKHAMYSWVTNTLSPSFSFSLMSNSKYFKIILYVWH